MSVSYTHLDYDDAIVAKRFEGARCPIEEIQAVKKGMHVVLTGEVVYDSFSKCDSFMAVSYTHLDVYKRQSLSIRIINREKKIKILCT